MLDHSADSSPSRCSRLPLARVISWRLPTALRFGNQSVECQDTTKKPVTCTETGHHEIRCNTTSQRKRRQSWVIETIHQTMSQIYCGPAILIKLGLRQVGHVTTKNCPSEGEPWLLSRWQDSRGESGADVEPIAGQCSAGEAYERIGVDGNMLCSRSGSAVGSGGVRKPSP
jgi:hypothetical protein